jgi:hypothetical protein
MGASHDPGGGPFFTISREEFESLRTNDTVRDPLSDVTRKERRALLGISALGAVMVKANILPQKISALGIDFGEINKTVLLRSIALLATFFLVAFFVYAVSDFLAWRIAIQTSLLESSKKAKEKQDDLSNSVYTHRLVRLGSISKRISFLRAILEFVFPICFAIYAIFVLFTAPS